MRARRTAPRPSTSMRPDADRRHDDREDEVARRVALHGDARLAHEGLLCLGEGLQLAEEGALAEGEVERARGAFVGHGERLSTRSVTRQDAAAQFPRRRADRGACAVRLAHAAPDRRRAVRRMRAVGVDPLAGGLGGVRRVRGA